MFKKIGSHLSAVSARREGFTLVEMLISLSIFMIFVTISGRAYVSITSANQTANETQKLYRDVRHVLDSIAADVRSGTIDFSCFQSPHADTPLDSECLGNTENQGHQSTVAFIVRDEDGASVRALYKIENGKIMYKKQRINTPGWSDIAGWSSLTSADTTFTDGAFTVFPLVDPYMRTNAADDNAQFQPTVGIHLVAKGFVFQTTYTSRSYGTHPLYAKQ